jgi:hypothetical protein
VNKTILFATLLVSAFILAGRQLAASLPPAVAAPQVVARTKLASQNAPIGSTTVFTAPEDGLYRLSAYPSITTPDAASRSQWDFNIFWTDLGAAESFAPFSYGNDNKAGTFENTPNPIDLQLKAGTTLSYSVTQNGAADSSVYSLYFVVERLE